MIRPIRTNVFFFIVFFCFFFRASFAQDSVFKHILFDKITIDNGLSQGMVNDIIQDHFGFLWFATNDGLNRYDGADFVIYRHDPSDSNSIADNYIKSVFEDAKGRIWVGTTTQGLELFDRETERFNHFKKVDFANGLIDPVEGITEDKQGRLWVMTSRGTVIVTEQKGSAAKQPVFSLTKFNTRKSNVFAAQDGTIWISELGSGLSRIRFTEDGKQHTEAIPVNLYNWYPRDDNGLEKFIFAFGEDTVGHKLYLFSDFSIACFSEAENTFKVLLKSDLNYFTGRATFNGNTIWIVNNFRLQQFDIKNNSLVNIGSYDSESDKFATNASCIYTDKTGILWTGTKGFGILKHNQQNEKFHHTDKESIHWMQQTSDGNVMLVKEGSSVYFFDYNNGSYTGSIPHTQLLKEPSYKPGIIDAVVQDNNGSFWIAKNNLINYESLTRKYTRYDNITAFPLYKDREGNIWFSQQTSLFSKYDVKQKTITDYKFPFELKDFPYKILQAIYEDDSGIFWLGTTKGLLRFDRANSNWKQFNNIPRDTASLSFDLIFCLCPDPADKNYLWVGTNGGGLNRFDMRTGKAVRYTTKDGLANDVVYGILSDNEGALWMSTNNGLSKLDKERKSFHNYNVNDGLQGNEYNRNAFVKTNDGTLFFGGVNGFNYFKPEELPDNSVPPNIMITSFKVTNRKVNFKKDSNLLSKPIYLTDTITLAYEYNMISFDFVALDFTNPGKNLYKYKLEGFDKDWINSGTEHSATYTNLDPGEYTLKIKASNSDAVWNEKGKALLLVILPPWYMTWWFRLAVVLIIVSAAYGFYRYRMAETLKMQEVRNRIASDLHDEIGSNLSNISIFSNVAQQRSNVNDETKMILHQITEYTQSSMEAMSDIVWMINARNDRFENIAVRMRTHAAEVFEATNCRLHLQFQEKFDDLSLNMEQRRNFYLIYKEAINNISKYAACTDVWISLKFVHNKLLLEIKDNGKGFDISKTHGNGLFNMKKRAKMLKGKLAINTQTGSGTVIQLSFEL